MAGNIIRPTTTESHSWMSRQAMSQASSISVKSGRGQPVLNCAEIMSPVNKKYINVTFVSVLWKISTITHVILLMLASNFPLLRNRIPSAKPSGGQYSTVVMFCHTREIKLALSTIYFNSKNYNIVH